MANANRPRHVYHAHTPTLLYVGVTLLIAVGAFHAQNNLLFWLFSLSLGVLIVSGLISGVMMMTLDVRRAPASPARADEIEGVDTRSAVATPQPLRVRYLVTNRSRWIPVFAITISEANDDEPRPSRLRAALRRLLRPQSTDHAVPASDTPFPAPPDHDADASPSRAAASRSDTRAHRARISAPARVDVAYVPPRSTITVEGIARCTRRGLVRSPALLVSTTFPFGIIRKGLRYDLPLRAVAWCAPHPAPPDLARAGLGALRADNAALDAPGSGDEFFALRPYRPGDPLRSIVWKAWARSPDLVVRQNAADALGSVWIVVRTAVPSDPAAQELALALATDLISQAQTMGLRVGLVMPDLNVRLAPGVGPLAAARMLDTLALAELTPPSETPLAPTPVRLHHSSFDRYVMIHPGPPDRALAPAGTLHLDATRLDAPVHQSPARTPVATSARAHTPPARAASEAPA
jgi:hypothetical protein